MSMRVFVRLCAAVCGCVALAAASEPSGLGSVTLSSDGHTLLFHPSVVAGAVAFGNFTDADEHPSGFGQLSVVTNSDFNDTVQARAAGFVEGVLTADRTVQHHDNMHSWLLKGFPGRTTLPDKYAQWLEKQDVYLRQQVASNTSVWWAHLGLMLAQFDGLVDGVNAGLTGNRSLSTSALRNLNAIGDYLDLLSALDPSRAPDWYRMDPEELMAAVRARSHCSALIKVTGNYSDIFFGHSSWFTYSSMLRIAKSYSLNFNNPGTASRDVFFSSYPGMLSSLDDFYIMQDSKLAMVQTTNGIYDKTLYKKVSTQSALAWHRVRLANHIAHTGDEWAQAIAYQNSGTYNNQYNVLDTKLWSPGDALKQGTLVVAEQIPGLVAWTDATFRLEAGYQPSYNVPMLPEIYEQSGYPALLAHYTKNGTLPLGALAGLSYQLAPRAQLFRRDQATVVDMPTFKALMRANDFKTDPYSHDDPYAAICSRGDLDTQPSAGGCYDTKVSSVTAMHNSGGVSHIINGPTTAGGTLPPFKWTSEFAGDAHVGQPTEFDYTFEEVTPVFARAVPTAGGRAPSVTAAAATSLE